mmetsp:Transcript_21427/g.21768  ORF Transcript_21427/g.21768 Transcript_21427/m.21768 type:complete len:102 (+) Transcript_21427:194-499(+)
MLPFAGARLFKSVSTVLPFSSAVELMYSENDGVRLVRSFFDNSLVLTKAGEDRDVAMLGGVCVNASTPLPLEAAMAAESINAAAVDNFIVFQLLVLEERWV